jgi:hypothetical protein
MQLLDVLDPMVDWQMHLAWIADIFHRLAKDQNR